MRPVRPGAREIGALILLPIGGLVIPVVGWFVGLALLYSSDLWNRRDKLIGTFLVPGGLATAFFLGAMPASTCTAVIYDSGRSVTGSCDGGLPQWLGVVLFAALVVIPLATTVYLGLRLRGRTQAPPGRR
jgi:hypothetical protein